MKLELYIGRQPNDTYSPEFTRVNLFNDEKVSLTIKNVSISDISKNFADFTQSFKVPADEVNNEIFKYYYNIDNDYQFNANIRVPARIDIDSIPFRIGKVQLETGGMSMNKPEYYTLTFYSNMVNLKDKFGDDQLSTLGVKKSDGLPTSLANYDFSYTDGEIYDRIMFTSYDDPIVVPVVGTQRYWTFDASGATTPATNINYTNSSSDEYITKEELRPAVSVKRLLEAIEERYDMTLGTSFKNSVIASSLYLWLNRSEDATITAPIPLNITNSLVTTESDPSFPSKNDRISLVDGFVNIPINDRGLSIGFGEPQDGGLIRYKITPATGQFYSASIVDDTGKVLKAFTNATGEQTIEAYRYGQPGFTSNIRNFATKVQIQSNFEVDFTVIATAVYFQTTPPIIYQAAVSSGNTITVNGQFQIATNLPEMTVADFFISLVKMYNLAIIPDELIENRFDLVSLTDYYQQGINDIVDITEYIDIEKHTIARAKLYKELKFKHEENDMLLNQGYFNGFGRRFGDEIFKLDSADGGDSSYDIQSKFKIIRNTNLSIFPVAYSITTEYEPILNTPVLFAYGGVIESQDSSGGPTDDRFAFRLQVGSGTPTAVPIQRMPVMATDIVLDGVYIESITFSQEADFQGVGRNTTLYSKYYEDYITQIYSVKTREWDFSFTLPSEILYQLKFNTTVIIGDYKYSIVELTVDLNTGAGNVKLLNKVKNGLI